MKTKVIILSIFVFTGVSVQRLLAQEAVVVHRVNCATGSCISCPACAGHGGYKIASPVPVPPDCTTDGTTVLPPQCGTIDCFSDRDISLISFGTDICEALELGRQKKARIKPFVFDVLGFPVNTYSISIASDAIAPNERDNFKLTNVTQATTTTTGVYSLAFNSGDEIDVTYAPTIVGTHTATKLVVTRTGTTPCGKEIALSALSKAVPSKEFILALDRSGSMSDCVIGCGTSGSQNKMDMLHISAKLFLDLLLTEPGTHQFGIVGYNGGVTVQSKANVAAGITAGKTFIDNLTPNGSTGIGGALTKSIEILHGPGTAACTSLAGTGLAADNKVIVLMSDGMQTAWPYVNNIRTSFPNCFKQATINTIGFGRTGEFDAALLQDLPGYSAADCLPIPEHGYFHANTTGTDFGLSKAFTSIFLGNTNYSEIIDPVAAITWTSNNAIIHSATITSSDKRALFVTFENPRYQAYYKLEMVSPKGDVVVNGNFGNGISGNVIEGDGYHIFRADFSGVSAPSDYTGEWVVRVKIDSPKRLYYDSTGNVLVGFSASAISDLSLDLQTASTGNVADGGSATVSMASYSTGPTGVIRQVSSLPGAEILVGLKAIESGLPARIERFDVQVTTPQGSVLPVPVAFDASRGYFGKFVNTFETGTYKVFARVVVANSKGELTTREKTHYVALSQRIPEKADECLSCDLRRGAVVVIIIVFVLVLVLVIWRWRTIRKTKA